MGDVVMVWTTVPVGDTGERLARTLVDERLAACVAILPAMSSVYRWDGDVRVEAERQLIIKTSLDRLDALRHRMTALHPYDLPELLVCPVEGGSVEYLAWVRRETSPDA